MPRLVALFSSFMLVAALLVTASVVGDSAPAGAACVSGTKTFSGTVQGEDSRFVNVLIGIELFAGNQRVDANGCPSTQHYHIVKTLNTSLAADGAVSGSGLTRNWSVQVPSNVTRAYVEVYPRSSQTNPPGKTDKSRYGTTMHHDTPITASPNIRLPLNCGLSGGGIEGGNGTITGRVLRNGRAVTPDSVIVFSLGPNSSPKILGWGIANVVSGGFVAEALAPDQHYQIFITQGGTSKRVMWVPMNRCADVDIDIDMNPNVVDPIAGATFFIANSFGGGNAAVTTVFGFPGDQPVVGDWDGNGFDDIGVRRGSRFEVRYGTGAGFPSKVFGYGKPGDELFIGDWDGNGTDTLAVRRGKEFYIRNDTNSGPAHVVLGYGKPGDEVFVGDWDGDGKDTFAVRRGNVFYLRNDLQPGNATTVFGYGKAGDEVLIGDWDGDREDTFAVRRGNRYFLRNDTVSGAAHITLAYGKPTDTVLVGDWNGDSIDTFGVHR